MSYSETLTAHGFFMYKRCRVCTGQLEEKFKPTDPADTVRKGFEIVVRPERNYFLIKQDGRRRSQGGIDQLESSLNINQI